MPIYEYECSQCSERVEAIQRLDDPPLTQCPECGGALRKRLSAPAFQFKGSGWYVTDYTDRGKPAKEEAKAASGDGGESGTKGDSAKTGAGEKDSKGDKGAAGGESGSSPAGDVTPSKSRSS